MRHVILDTDIGRDVNYLLALVFLTHALELSLKGVTTVYGATLLRAGIAVINAGSTELWIYTGSNDNIARTFYLSLDFELLGAASDYAPGQTMDDSDIVLRCALVTTA